MKEVFAVNWEESERGWGCRPDGISLHLSAADAREFIKEYWHQQPDEVPDEYSRPCTEPHKVSVNDETYAKVIASSKGIRIWQFDLKTIS